MSYNNHYRITGCKYTLLPCAYCHVLHVVLHNPPPPPQLACGKETKPQTQPPITNNLYIHSVQTGPACCNVSPRSNNRQQRTISTTSAESCVRASCA